MNRWEHTIDIKSVFMNEDHKSNVEDLTIEDVQNDAKQVAERIAGFLDANNDLDSHLTTHLLDIMEDFGILGVASDANPNMFDMLLDQLYDFADDNSIWIS